MKYIWDEKERMKNFIDKDKIVCLLKNTKKPNYSELKEILQKSFDLCETLSLEEVAKLISVDESEHLELMYEYAAKIKKKVYDNRIVVFAPLYVSNYCMNNCLYCGFRVGNKDVIRKTLSLEEIKKEVEILA
ncbi:MAG: [FeFe] hydrogenase H-cluster radical SAM maturase HydG, partial [Spirochaetes bacterium]|nr:[FeFe] hydrogenase H-cluster radical SAM maturase HydG [Spirochaetota bacterium]